MASLERHEAAWEADGDALRPEQGQKTRFGNMHPPRRHIDRRCRRLIRSLHAPLAQEERMTSLGQMSGYDSSCRTRDNSNIRQYGIVANWARVSNPPDCPDPGFRPARRRDQVGKRPNTGRTDARASVGRRHLLNSFVHRLRTRPRLSRAKRHFGGSLHPSNVLGQSPLRPRDYRLQKGGTTCTWPAQWFLFSISDPKKRCAQ